MVKAVVLAAGVGSRLEPLTSFVPKPLLPVANRPIIEHALDLLARHGIFEVTANAHYLAEQLIAYFAGSDRRSLCIVKEEELSGDAGGVRACRAYLSNETFVVLMGDLLTSIDLSALIAEHRKRKALATIAVKQVEDVSRFGVIVRDEHSLICDFQEKPSAQEARSNLASTGVYVLEPEIFQHIPEQGVFGFGKQLFPALVKAGLPLLAVETNAYWSDVGTIASYWQANLDALSGKLELNLPGQKTAFGWLGNESTISADATINGIAMIGQSTLVAAGVNISGRVVIGDHCHIGNKARLENVVVLHNTNIEPGTHLSDCVVGYGCAVKAQER